MEEDLAIEAALHDNFLNSEERLLQRMILRNFMGRKRATRIEDLRGEQFLDDEDENEHNLSRLSGMVTKSRANHFSGGH